MDTRLTYQYRVIGLNTVGDTHDYADPALNEIVSGGFPNVTVKSAYSNVANVVVVPAAPTNLAATLQAGPKVSLTWTDNATNETGFVVERSTNGGAFVQIATPGPRANTGSVTYVDATVTLGNTYAYRVAASNSSSIFSAYSNTVTVLVAVPPAPSNLNAFPTRIGSNDRWAVSWKDNANNETGFTLMWSTNATFTTGAGQTVGTANLGSNSTTYMTGNLPRVAMYFRIRANNVLGSSAWVTTAQIQPAVAALSPLVFLNGFTFGMTGWTGQVGDVQAGTAAAMEDDGSLGLVASWGDAEPQGTLGQPAYVYHVIPNTLGSFMATFDFNPHGAVTSDTPVDVFTGLDAGGAEILGVQYLHTAANPNLYQIRGWTKTVNDMEVYTDWVSIANAKQSLQLDWQSAETSSLNLYIGGEQKASVTGDTSSYKLVQERLGPSRGVSSINAPTVGTVYLDGFASLSTDITSPFSISIHNIFLPLVNR